MELNKVNKPHYNDYGTWIRSRFPFRVQKISVDAGFTCPNRDGRMTTAPSIHPTATRGKASASNCKKASDSFHGNTPI